MWPFFDFQYGFRSSRSTVDLLTVVSDRTANAFDRVWRAGLLHKLKSNLRISGPISSFLRNRRLRVVLDGIPQMNIQSMLEFLKAPLLVLHFHYYKLITFLMMLFVTLLSMLMILLSILSVIRHLIWGNLNWLLNLNLIYETLWTSARSGLLISMLGKLNWFRLTGLITMVQLM